MNAGAWTGIRLGNYEIGPLLGQGGMAQVYKARHTALNRDVAIKFFLNHLAVRDGFTERFQREGKLVTALRHSNIIQVYDFDTNGESYYMIMEYIEGQTLSTRLEQMRAQKLVFSLRQAVDLLLALCSALGYAHAREMVHYDVKPGNVMFTRKERPVLTDFGFVNIIGGTTTTSTGLVIGTPIYMSPEQAYGETGDARSDIYSLGVMLFEMVTGHVPFQGDTPLNILFKKINEPFPSAINLNPRLPEEIERIICKATEKRPEDRYQTCRELSEALRKVDCTPVIQGENPPQQPAFAVSQQDDQSTITVKRFVSLDGLQPVFTQILGSVGQVIEADHIARAMRENPAAFPFERLDEFLDRMAAYYQVTDQDKKVRLRQQVFKFLANSK